MKPPPIRYASDGSGRQIPINRASVGQTYSRKGPPPMRYSYTEVGAGPVPLGMPNAIDNSSLSFVNKGRHHRSTRRSLAPPPTYTSTDSATPPTTNTDPLGDPDATGAGSQSSANAGDLPLNDLDNRKTPWLLLLVAGFFLFKGR